jgi:hypothetical protein
VKPLRWRSARIPGISSHAFCTRRATRGWIPSRSAGASGRNAPIAAARWRDPRRALPRRRAPTPTGRPAGPPRRRRGRRPVADAGRGPQAAPPAIRADVPPGREVRAAPGPPPRALPRRTVEAGSATARAALPGPVEGPGVGKRGATHEDGGEARGIDGGLASGLVSAAERDDPGMVRARVRTSYGRGSGQQGAAGSQGS